MLAIQVMISLSVLSLSVMMPAVARDLAIDPKLVGIFTAIIYGVAAVAALAAAEPIVRLGAVRICQAALLMAAIGLAFNALAMVAATVIAVIFIGAAQGPINPASAHVLAQRVPREWFGIGVFAEADRRAHRLRPGRPRSSRSCSRSSAGAAPAWSPPALPSLAALVVELLRSASTSWSPPASRRSASGARSASCSAIAQLRVLGLVGLRLCRRPAHLHLLSRDLSLRALRPQHRPRRPPAVGVAARRHGGPAAERRHGRPHPAHAAAGLDRHRHDGWAASPSACWRPDTPFWLIALVVVGYGSVVISWNGTSQAEFAHLSPPGETAAVAAVQTALAFSGAVFGPPLFALIASLGELPHGLLRRGRSACCRPPLADRGGATAAERLRLLHSRQLTISPHFLVSLAWKAARSSGEPGNGTPRSCASALR